MGKLKVLGCLMILFNLVFTEESGSDSSKLNILNSLKLKRQKLFYPIRNNFSNGVNSSSENWIPPSLPNESECIGVGGCCLMPLSGFLILRETFKKEALKESLQPIIKPKFSIGISYNPGIAFTGIALVGPRIGGFAGIPPEAILALFYLNNRVEIDAQYHFDRHWALGIGGGYMWIRLNERNPWFFPKGSLEGEVWTIYDKSCFWEITTFSPSIELLYYWVNTKIVRYMGGGLEYNLSRGLAHGKYAKWSGETYPDTIIEYLEGDALRWAKGIGAFFDVGFERLIMKNILFDISLKGRYSLAKEYRWELPSGAVLGKPITYSFTGIYLKAGFTYILFKQQTRKEAR